MKPSTLTWKRTFSKLYLMRTSRPKCQCPYFFGLSNKKQYQLGDRSTPAGSKPKEAMAALDSRGTNCSRRTTRSKRSAKTVNCPVDGKGMGAWHHAILWIA